ncbi:MAG: GH3 auxin-responsive promoter family protein, partial [Clostridia bacterium]|nr:GH3 auxin-responsive promoter family protein [Clostridia bacterium]
MNELKLAQVRKTAFSALISGGKKSIEHLRDMEKKGQAVNDSLLHEILRKNARTAYGQQRGFAGIRTYEQYAAQVPLSEYQDYEDAIQRMSDLGEQNLLMSSTPDYYFLTSGTNGAPKRIPSSREQTRMIRNYLNLYRFGLVAQTLGDIWTEGATLSPVEVRVKKTDSGTLEGYFSAKLLYDLGDLVQTASLSPREVIWSEPGENTGYMHLRYGLACENVTELNAAYVTALLEMMRYLETNWQSLVRDIREGTIPEDAGYSPEKRAALLRNLRPDPERADVLEAEFQKGFEDPILPRIWRKLSLVTAAAGATFAPYLEQLRRYIGNDVQVYYHGYTASEAVMGVPVSLNSQQYELLPDSCFYEFQPYDEESGSILPFAEGAPLLRMSQLETGKAYVVIITNICG